jgi:DNA-binding response OmpR family regulator
LNPTVSTRLLPANLPNPPFTILCVEDDPAIAKLYELRLPSCGARVLCCTNGHDGYFLAIESNPDLILLDCELPDVQGVDLVARFRSNPSLANVAILMLTGLDTRTIRRRLLMQGVIDVLPKPVDFDELFRHIARFQPMTD